MSAKTICMLSLASGSGKTVIGNALAGIAVELGKTTNFFKPLSVTEATVDSCEGIRVSSQMKEYANNCNSQLSVRNNPCLYDCRDGKLYLEGTFVADIGLLSSDNIQSFAIPETALNQIHDRIKLRIWELASTAEVLIIEGGGNCLLEGDMEFSNRLPASTNEADVVLVLGGKDGSFEPLIAGFHSLAPLDLRNRIAGFVVNGVPGLPEELLQIVRKLEARYSFPCLGVIPWFEFDSDESKWKSSIRRTVREFAHPLVKLLTDSSCR